MSALAARSVDRRRNAALLAASMALHLLVLTPLALRWIEEAPIDISRPDAPILIQIEPRPVMEGEAARSRPAPAAEAAVIQPSPSAVVAVQAPVARAPEEDDEDDQSLPLRPVPRVPATPGPGAPAPPAEAERWRVRPNDTAGRVAQSLRNSPVGCRLVPGLTAAERAACDQEFGQAASEAPPLEGTGNAARDARFAREGAAALAQYEARRRPLSGGVGVVGISPDCPGGNLRGSCAGAHLPEHYQHREHDVRRTRPPN